MFHVASEVSSRKILNVYDGVADEDNGQQKQQTGHTMNFMETKYYMCAAVCMCMYKHGVKCCILCQYFCQPVLTAALPISISVSILVCTINGPYLSKSCDKLEQKKNYNISTFSITGR
jgi:hypothetical protein